MSFRNNISSLTGTKSNSLLRRIAALCVGLLIMNGGNLTAQVISTNGTVFITNTAGTIVTTNTLENNAGSTFDNGGTLTTATLTNAGTLQGDGTHNVSSAFTNTGTFTAGLSTVDFNGAGAQTIPSLTYNNLILDNAGTKSAGGALTVNGDFTIGGTATFDAGTSLSHLFAGNWIVNTTALSPVSFTTASTISFNTPTVAAATSISGTSTAAIDLNNVNVNNTSGFSTGNTLSLTGILAIASNVTYTNNGIVSVAGNITGGNAAATFVNSTNATLNAGGVILAIGTLNAIAAPNTVSYTSTTAAQTVKATTYHNLDINNTGQIATINATMTLNGNLSVTAGTLTVSAGTFTVTGTTTVGGIFNMGAATAMALNNAATNNGTINITSATGTKSFTDIINNGTLNFTAAETATLSGNLTMGNSSILSGTLTGIVNVGGNLNITGTGTTIGRSTITVTGTTNVTGGVDFNSATGTKTFVGLLTISGSGAWSSTLNSAFIFQGGLTHTGASFSSGTGIYTFNTNSQSIAGTSQLTIANLTVTGAGITVSNDNTNVLGLTVSTALVGTGGLINPINALLNIGGTSTITVLTATAIPNTVEYNGTAAAQTVKATTYHHLTVDKTTQVATVSATATVNGDINVISGTLTVSGGTFTVTGITTVTGTMNMGAAAAIAMNSPVNVNGTLILSSATGTKSFTDLNLNANSTLNSTAIETATLSGNLTMGNNSTITGTATGIIAVGGNLNITGTGTTIGRSTITVTGTTTVSGTVDFNNATGIKTFTGLVTISTLTGAWTSSANSAFTFQGGIQNDNSFSSGTGTYTFNTNSQTLSGTGGITFSGIVAIVGAITVDVTTTNSFGGSITGSVAGSTLRPSTGLTLNFLGAAVLATGTLDLTTNVPNSVVYSSTTVAQSVKGTVYYNLEINGDNQVKTLAANDTVTNLLTVTAGTFSLSTFNLIMQSPAPIILNDSLLVPSATGTKTWNSVTINATGTLSCSVAETFSVLGDWTNNGGTFTPGTSIVSFNGTGPQAINGTAAIQTFYSVTVNNSVGPVSAGGSTTTVDINGAFTLTLGSFTAPPTMTVAGNWTEATGTTFTPGTGTVIFNGTAAQQILGTAVTQTFNNVEINKTVATTLSTGGSTTTITVNGTLTQTQGNFTPPATLNVSGITTLTDGTFSIGTGTKTFTLDVNINSTAIFSLASATGIANIGGNLNMSGTGSVAGSATGTISVTGNLNISGTGNTIGRSTINVNGTTNVTGTVDFNSATGTKTFVGLLTISGIGAWSSTLNSAFILQGGLTHSGASFSSGTGIYTFNTNSQSIAGTSPLTFANLTVTGAGITVSNDNTNVLGLTVSTALAGTGGLINPANALLNIGGTSTITVLTATAIPNTVEYTSTTGAQTVKATTYHHLTVDKTTMVATISATITVNGNLTVTSGTLTLSGGTFTVTGTTTVNGIMNMGATVATLINGPTVINGTLNFTSAAGTDNFADITNNGTMNFTAIETAALSSNLTMGNNSTITGTVTGIITVGGNLNITGTGTTIGRSTITVTGTTSITGDVDFNSAVGTKTFGGLITLSGTGAWTNSANSPFILQGGLTHNGATFTSGTGTYTFNTNNQNISGTSSITFNGIVAITGAITITNSANVTLVTDLTGSVAGSTWFNDVNSTLNVGTVILATGTLNASGNPNTVNYNGGVQTVKGATYHHLQLTAAGAKTAGAAITINGNLAISGMASLDDAGFQIAGNAGGTFTLASGSTLTLGSAATATLFPTNFINGNITLDAASTVIYNSDLAQTISAVPTYGNLTLTSTVAVTKTISAAATVATDLTVGINNTMHVTGTGSVQINTGNLILNGSLINDNTIDIGL